MTTFKPGDWVKDAVTGDVGLVLQWGVSNFKVVDFELDVSHLLAPLFPPLKEHRATTPMPGEVRAAKRRIRDERDYLPVLRRK